MMDQELSKSKVRRAEAYIDGYWQGSQLMELAPAQRVLTLLYGYDLYFFVEQVSRAAVKQDLTSMQGGICAGM
jgi:hypothetical protein